MKTRPQIFRDLKREVKNIRELCNLSNEELANKLLEEVWADLDILSYKSSLIETVIDRLKGTKQGECYLDNEE